MFEMLLLIALVILAFCAIKTSVSAIIKVAIYIALISVIISILYK